jgi:hypothetical protein
VTTGFLFCYGFTIAQYKKGNCLLKREENIWGKTLLEQRKFGEHFNDLIEYPLFVLIVMVSRFSHFVIVDLPE